jgi:hypothetical protein
MLLKRTNYYGVVITDSPLYTGTEYEQRMGRRRMSGHAGVLRYDNLTVLGLAVIPIHHHHPSCKTSFVTEYPNRAPNKQNAPKPKVI